MKVDFKLVEGLDSVMEITIPKFSDERGSFQPFPLFNRIFDSKVSVQFNQSFSNRGVLRGLHHQVNNPQGKLVSCVNGAALDLLYDNRPTSKTYKQSKAILLDSPDKYLFIPKGFLHGFISLEDNTIFQYFIDTPYDPTDEESVSWEIMEDKINFDELGLSREDLIISEKDND